MLYTVEDCMKKYCESLRKHVMKMIIFKKRNMKLLTSKQKKSYENSIKKKNEYKHAEDIKYGKDRGYCY